VQTTHKISGDQAQGYANYLTSISARGDYYAEYFGSGEDDQEVLRACSGWHGSWETLTSLGIDPDQPVGRRDLKAMMAGVSPRDGGELRPAGGNGTRVAGIDLTFSAPKSVSALWALSDHDQRWEIERAHVSAVNGAMARLQRDVALVRTRTDGKLEWQRASSLVAAEFVHTTSRLTRDQERGGVPDPQLHSHVVVLGAEREDGRFVAVDSRELFRSARANGAYYRAELAANLQRMGFEVQARTGRDQRYFEVRGVPQALSEHWSARASEIERAAREFRTRYGREPRAAELGALTTSTRGGKAAASVDVEGTWRAVGEEHGLTAEGLAGLRAERSRERSEPQRLAQELLRDVVRHRSTVSERDLKARAYELSAGVCDPADAEEQLAELQRSGELIALENGLWTTRELRDLERQTVARAGARAGERAAPVSAESVRAARLAAQRELGAPFSAEQRQALERITGRGGVSVLVGEAGTGKGVVLGAAADAWRAEGYEVSGTAVAGATAKRLGADAGIERTMTTDALLHRAEQGRLTLNERSVVVMDEAGMADTRRLAELTKLTAETGSKLVLVGDERQLPSIQAGGLFGAVESEVPSAQLTEVRRANHDWERRAWGQVREGEAARALAAYGAHERLHLSETRQEAAEQMLGAWAAAREAHPGARTVMLTDASNAEMDRLNATAQEHRAAAGELGAGRVELPGRPYGLAAGDEVMLTSSLWVPGQARIENGTTRQVLETRGKSGLTIRTEEPEPREVAVDTREFGELRLSYAQHVYKAQGRTVDQAFVLTGGWQTDRERAYVAVTRARERTDIYVSREDLGEQGMDAGAIERLAERFETSSAQEPSIARPERDPQQELAREAEVYELAREEREREAPERDVGIEPDG
jgi:conjugative relaxase-like TrwC/TraI family protein